MPVEWLIRQYDTYHPLLPLIPEKLHTEVPLVRCCAVCGPEETKDKPLAKCTRCMAASYCGRDHQKQHFHDHKKVCRHIQKCREKMDSLARSLDPELFTDFVGQFWLQLETRPYMHAKRDYVLALTVTRSHEGVSLALEQALDHLRLNRVDNLAVRDMVPALMLMLGKTQDCYDFIKWYAMVDQHEYDWADMSLPFLNVKDADMTEAIIDEFKKYSSVFHLAALAYIQLKLMTELAQSVDTDDAEDAQSAGDLVLASTVGPLYKKLQLQASEAMGLTHARNPHYWKCVQNPHSLSCDVSPGQYAQGDKFEVQNWLVPHSLLWSQDPLGMQFARVYGSPAP